MIFRPIIMYIIEKNIILLKGDKNEHNKKESKTIYIFK